MADTDTDRNKTRPPFAVEQHLRELFGAAYEAAGEPNAAGDDTAPNPDVAATPVGEPPTLDRATALAHEQAARPAEQNQARYDW